MIRRLFIAVCLALFASAPVQAGGVKPIDQEFLPIREKQPFTFRSDRGYVLLRNDTDLSKFTLDILRVPSEAELTAYDAAKQAEFDKLKAKKGDKAGSIDSFVFDYAGRPNFFELNPGKRLAMVGKVAMILAELTPGDYVVYGTGFSNFTYQCLCLGTVRFSVRAGEVTDLGSLLVAKAWEPSPIPELAGEVDLGKSAVMDYGLFAVGLRPRQPGDWLPPGIDAAKVIPAELHAVGPFVDTNTVLINRLAAIPGVLGYDQGKVIDLRKGKEVPPN
ncbi:MAG: hypothetical protein ACKOPM_01080 [Novosphingobium sp.]